MEKYVIKKVMLTNNTRYKKHEYKKKIGYMQHSTACPGIKAKEFIRRWNVPNSRAEVEFVIDDTGIYQCLPFNIRCYHCGGSGNNTHVGCEICEPSDARYIPVNWKSQYYGNKYVNIEVIMNIQKELKARGYDPKGIDGSFGKGCEAAVKEFQKANGLKPDGIVGRDTLAKLQNREGSYVRYDAKKNQAYFEDVYRKAVYTCTCVLKGLGVNTVNDYSVLCHCEGHRKGIASNHADVMHWFCYHNKDMNDFRKDVKYYMATGILPYHKEEVKPVEPVKPVNPYIPENNNDNEEEKDMKRYNTYEEMPDWAKSTVKKMIENGKIAGCGGPKDKKGYPTDMNLTMDMLRILVMLAD